MKRLITLIYLSIITINVGCASLPMSKAYQPTGQAISKPATKAILVIVEGDGRPLKGKSHIGSGFLAYIPLVPYGHQQFALESMEGSKPLPREVADTVVKDLRAAGIAQFVGYQDKNDPRQRSIKEPYYLHLTLKEGVWDRYLTAYGTSFAGVCLWTVLPVSYGSVMIAIEAELKDSEGVSLGLQTFNAKESVTSWIYSPFNYGPKMPKAYDQISPQLRQFIIERIAKNTF